jgi:pimeloyl-ACP methyl ester carboxylesterase
MDKWSIIDRIHHINVPTLLLSGKYDGVPASNMQPFFDQIDKVKWVTFAESSHFPNLEEPDEFLKVLGGFLSLK